MTMARLNSDELDLIEHALIDLGKLLSYESLNPIKNAEKIALVTKTIKKMNTIRKCSALDAIDITPAHGG